MFKDEKLGVRAHEKRGKGLELRTAVQDWAQSKGLVPKHNQYNVGYSWRCESCWTALSSGTLARFVGACVPSLPVTWAASPSYFVECQQLLHWPTATPRFRAPPRHFLPCVPIRASPRGRNRGDDVTVLAFVYKSLIFCRCSPL